MYNDLFWVVEREAQPRVTGIWLRNTGTIVFRDNKGVCWKKKKQLSFNMKPRICACHLVFVWHQVWQSFFCTLCCLQLEQGIQPWNRGQLLEKPEEIRNKSNSTSEVSPPTSSDLSKSSGPQGVWNGSFEGSLTQEPANPSGQFSHEQTHIWICLEGGDSIPLLWN